MSADEGRCEAHAPRPLRLLVAYSAQSVGTSVDVTSNTIWRLTEAGIEVEPLVLPRDAHEDRYLPSLLSLRLTPTESAGDALLCLDLRTAVFRHPRKWVKLPEFAPEVLVSGSFADRVRLAGVKEANCLIVPDGVAATLRARGWSNVASLAETHPSDPFGTVLRALVA